MIVASSSSASLPTPSEAMSVAPVHPPSQDEVIVSDRSVSMAKANLVGFMLLPVVVALVLVPFALLHGWAAVAAGWKMVMEPFWFFLLWMLGSVVVHEGLHGLGFRLGGAKRGEVRFGFNLRSVTPYATCSVPMQARSYRMSAVLPGLLLGAVPFVVSLAAGAGWLAIISMWMLATAIGDFMIVWLIRDVPPTSLVQDHPDRAGCQVITP